LSLSGCATQPTPATTAGAGRPGVVEGYLTSALDAKPYTAKELADPVRRSVVEQCEQAGGLACREHLVPLNRRGTFVRGVDPGVIARFHMVRLPAGQPHTSTCHFVDPTGSVAEVMRDTVAIPASWPRDGVLSFTCTMRLDATRPPGMWAVQFITSEGAASELSFEVLGTEGERTI
jgi:hypothetical protein